MAIAENEKVYVSFKTATNWLHNNYVLCNNIINIDESITDQIPYDEETDEFKEIFQFYITDANKEDTEYLNTAFGLEFAYSDVLDCYVLLVDHFGTSWDYVRCQVNTEFKYAPDVKGTEHEYREG